MKNKGKDAKLSVVVPCYNEQEVEFRNYLLWKRVASSLASATQPIVSL